MRAAAGIAILLAMACAAPSTEADAGSTDGGQPGPAPGRPARGPPAPPPSAEAQAWLDLHNAVRRNAQPPPSPPLPALTWSSGAATVAQAWADRCMYEHNQGRGDRGENIAASAPPGHWSIADV